MDKVEIVDEKGRKYLAFQNGEQHIIIGPPESLVDSMNLPEPFATNLHNALYARGIFNLAQARDPHRNIIGVLQEALQLDAQKLIEAFFLYETT